MRQDTRTDRAEPVLEAGEAFEAMEPRQMLSAGLPALSPFPIWTADSPAAMVSMVAGSDVAHSEQGIALPSLTLINAAAAQADVRFAGITGRGTSVVIIDSGINRAHPFFGADANRDGVADRIVFQYDFADNDTNASDPSGHGSNVSSIIASQDAVYRGVAPEANIIHLKVFTDAGAGNFGMVERALQWVVNNAWRYNVVSVNMSLGDGGNWNTPQSRYGLGDELAALAGSGIAVVASAGNDFARTQGLQGLAYPAADPNVIAVGAVYAGDSGAFTYSGGAQATSTAADRIAPFSQRTTAMPMIFAPGAPIVGAAGSGTGMTAMHGTSQAAPHVAGSVALLQQLSMQVLGRKLDVSEVRASLWNPGKIIVDGDDEADNVANTGAEFRRLSLSGSLNRIVRMAPDGQPEVGVSHAAVDVGVGQVIQSRGVSSAGQSVIRTFVVRNDGKTAMSAASLRVEGSAFRLERGFLSGVVQPGTSTNFRVIFTPPAVGVYRAVITFATNDPDERAYRFEVQMGASPSAALADVRLIA